MPFISIQHINQLAKKMTQNLNLKRPEDTAKLGQSIGKALSAYVNEHGNLPFHALLLRGPLGGGKTFLTKNLVQALPRGDLAEVSSPSFTLCNSYGTMPEVLHVDLYRCEFNIPQELWDAFEIPDTFIIVEWAEFLPVTALPQNFLDITFDVCENGRSICITAHGPKTELFLQNLTLTS